MNLPPLYRLGTGLFSDRGTSMYLVTRGGLSGFVIDFGDDARRHGSTTKA